MTSEERVQVQRALDNHEALRNSWFWGDNGNAKSRGYREKQLNFTVTVTHAGDVYEYTSSVRISRKNFYYQGRFAMNGQRGDVRIFKRLAGAG